MNVKPETYLKRNPLLKTCRELYLQGKALLLNLPQADPALESKLLLMKAASLSEMDFFCHSCKKISKRAEHRFFKWIQERRKRVPLAYLLGEKEFWSLPFYVFPGILIPRPETELLVEKAVELILRRGSLIVEIGTGSGCISIALAKEFPLSRIIATDISLKALRIAKLNAERHRATAITFVRGDLFAPCKRLSLEKKADLIVCNPPYVSEKKWTALAPEIRAHEPKPALVSGPSGLEFISRLTKGARAYLRSSGRLLFEIGQGHENSVRSLFASGWANVKIFDDLRGIPRVVAAEKA